METSVQKLRNDSLPVSEDFQNTLVGSESTNLDQCNLEII